MAVRKLLRNFGKYISTPHGVVTQKPRVFNNSALQISNLARLNSSLQTSSTSSVLIAYFQKQLSGYLRQNNTASSFRTKRITLFLEAAPRILKRYPCLTLQHLRIFLHYTPWVLQNKVQSSGNFI
jgi:hypothetical protein